VLPSLLERVQVVHEKRNYARACEICQPRRTRVKVLGVFSAVLYLLATKIRISVEFHSSAKFFRPRKMKKASMNEEGTSSRTQ